MHVFNIKSKSWYPFFEKWAAGREKNNVDDIIRLRSDKNLSGQLKNGQKYARACSAKTENQSHLYIYF